MFKDREDAGLQLAEALLTYQNGQPLILAIPRGGVELGFHVSRRLQCDFSIIICRKLGYPEHPEAAFGAIAEDGSIYIDPRVLKVLSEEKIREVRKREEAEIKRRIKKYRQGSPLPELKGRTVILVDDGIATGATLFSAIKLCKNKMVKRLIVAAPVSGIQMYKILQNKVDEVVILETPSDFFAVSQAYQDFQRVNDEDVIEFMNKSEKRINNKSIRSVTGPTVS